MRSLSETHRRLAAGLALALIAQFVSTAVIAQEEEREEETEEPAPVDADAPEDEEGAKSAGDFAIPTFKTPVAEEKFKAGHQLFEEGKYAEARKTFDPLKGAAVSADDKNALGVWILACDGGVMLDGYQRTAKAGKLRETYFMAINTLAQYRDTPIGSRFETFLDELRSRVIDVLDSFDVPSRRFSKAFGKTFINDKAIVFRGANCLLWTNTKDGKPSVMKFDKLPGTLTRYHSLLFWVRAERPVEVNIFLECPSPQKGGKEQDPSVLQFAYTPPAGSTWKKVEIDLTQFRAAGGATLGSVESVKFQIEARSPYKIYFDEISLVRKDSSAAAAGSGTNEAGKREPGKKDTAKKAARKNEPAGKKAKAAAKKNAPKGQKKAAPQDDEGDEEE